jgi:shikimate kinase
MDDLLVRTCVKRAAEAVGEALDGYRLTVRTEIPPSMGLKSSSSVCNAVVGAVFDYFNHKAGPLDAIRLGVGCARECGVTITGAFDDACGCGLGGLVVTDNSKDELLLRKEVPRIDVVVCVPDRSIPKSKVPVSRYRELENEYRALASSIEEDYLGVLTRNGARVAALAGVDDSLTRKPLGEGALAAGVSGTGPAFVAMAERGDGARLADALGCKAIITETRRHGHRVSRRKDKREGAGPPVQELHPQGGTRRGAVGREVRDLQPAVLPGHQGDGRGGKVHGRPRGAPRREAGGGVGRHPRARQDDRRPELGDHHEAHVGDRGAVRLRDDDNRGRVH